MRNPDVSDNTHPAAHTQNRRKLEKNRNTLDVEGQLFFIIHSTECKSS
jgi:hypothetical protein